MEGIWRSEGSGFQREEEEEIAEFWQRKRKGDQALTLSLDALSGSAKGSRGVLKGLVAFSEAGAGCGSWRRSGCVFG